MTRYSSEIVLGVKIPVKKAIEILYKEEDRKKPLKIIEEYGTGSEDAGDDYYDLYHQLTYTGPETKSNYPLRFYPIQHDDSFADDEDNMGEFIFGHCFIKVIHEYISNDDETENDISNFDKLLEIKYFVKQELEKYNLQNLELSVYHTSSNCGCCS